MQPKLRNQIKNIRKCTGTRTFGFMDIVTNLTSSQWKLFYLGPQYLIMFGKHESTVK
jgi:hypothetical protein